MGRSGKIMMVMVVGVAAALAVYFGAMHLCARQAAGPDELAWLRREFGLNEAQMRSIRELHDGYLPKCQEMCAEIAKKRKETEASLVEPRDPALTEKKLVELGTLRAQCQAQMLRHFEEVSRAMPPEQGRRYLAEMERLTLGFHEQFESSMKGEQSPPPGHAGH